MAGERVLVVDDNGANARLAAFVLRKAGYEVVTADSAASARAELAQRLPDLVLMDLQLPGTDGLTFTRELRAAPATHGLPIVAVTAYAMRGDEERALAAGCDGYLSKPIDTRTLASRVAGWIEEGKR